MSDTTRFPLRWLNATELLHLFYNAKAQGLPILQAVVKRPPSGSYFLYDASQRVRDDGYEYCKKLHGKKWEMKESYIKLVVRGVARLSCFTSELSEHPTFRRRIYRLLDTEFESADADLSLRGIQLVHYLDSDNVVRHIPVTPSYDAPPANQRPHPDKVALSNVSASCHICPSCMRPLGGETSASSHNITTDNTAEQRRSEHTAPFGLSDHQAGILIPGLSSSNGDANDHFPMPDQPSSSHVFQSSTAMLSVSESSVDLTSGPFDAWDLSAHLSGALPLHDGGGYYDGTEESAAHVATSTVRKPLPAARSPHTSNLHYTQHAGSVGGSPVISDCVQGGSTDDIEDAWAAASASDSSCGGDSSVDEVGQHVSKTVEGRTNRLLQTLIAQVCLWIYTHGMHFQVIKCVHLAHSLM